MDKPYWSYKVKIGKPRPIWLENAYKIKDDFDYFLFPNGNYFTKEAEPLISEIWNKKCSREPQNKETVRKLISKGYMKKSTVWGCNQVELIKKDIEDNGYYKILFLDIADSTIDLIQSNLKTKIKVLTFNDNILNSKKYHDNDFNIEWHFDKDSILSDIDCIVCNANSIKYKEYVKKIKFYIIEEEIYYGRDEKR